MVIFGLALISWLMPDPEPGLGVPIAQAQEGAMGETGNTASNPLTSFDDSLPNLFDVMVSLVLVLGLVLGLAFVFRRFVLKSGPLPGSGKHIRLVESKGLGNRGSVHLIKVHSRAFVVGSGSDGSLCKLAEIDDADWLSELERTVDVERSFASHFSIQRDSMRLGTEEAR